MGKERIVFFSPFRDTLNHSLPEALLNKELKSKFEVLSITCGGFLQNGCISMSAAGFDDTMRKSTKKIFCKICIKKSTYIDTKLHLNSQKFEDLQSGISGKTEELGKGIYADIQNYAKFERIIDNKNSMQIHEIEASLEYKNQVENLTLIAIKLDKLIKDYSPKIMIVYNAFYSVTKTAVRIAESNGIKSYSLHAGPGKRAFYSNISIYEASKDLMLAHKEIFWEKFKKQDLHVSDIENVKDYIEETRSAKNPLIFSEGMKVLTKEKILEKFKIDTDKKIVLVALSSEDEATANEVIKMVPTRLDSCMFKSQREWLGFIVNQLKDREDVIVIIRTHPREYPSHRDNKRSLNSIDFINELRNLPTNFRLNTPEDKLSIYNLLQVTSVALTYTSSSAVDAVLFGVPVLTQDTEYIHSFPAEMCTVYSKKEDFPKILERLFHLNSADNFNYFVIACKWIIFYTEINTETFINYKRSEMRIHRRSNLLKDLNKLLGPKLTSKLKKSYYLFENYLFYKKIIDKKIDSFLDDPLKYTKATIENNLDFLGEIKSNSRKKENFNYLQWYTFYEEINCL